MTLLEAIFELENTTFLYADNPKSQKVEAMRLGIEALKFNQEWRKGRHVRTGYLLPGETPE